MTGAGVVTIRHVGPDDWAHWREIRLRGLREAPEAFADSVRKAAAENDHERRYRDRIAAAEACLVADDDVTGEPVGLVAVDRHADGGLELTSMFVAPEMRGRGVARALIAHVVDVAAGRLLHLRVIADNTAAVAAYRSGGFELVDPEPDAENCVTMRRRPTHGTAPGDGDT